MAPRLVFESLDMTNEANVALLAESIRRKHGGIDIVISNAAARIAKEIPAADQVAAFVATNNHGTRRMFEHFMPALRRPVHSCIRRARDEQETSRAAAGKPHDPGTTHLVGLEIM
ncbi:MAG: SDR family NAD(P)-dependent oxidoreductase [Steroidobacteraceae bacterium]